MAISKVAVANFGLQKLGAKRIADLSENSPNARSMSAAYDIVRRSLLRKYDWGFAIRRASIAADPAQTTWGGHNRFSLPNDYLRIIRDDESGQAVDWLIESDAQGTYIITDDAAPLHVRYIADLDDPSFYDATFIEAMASKLAIQCSREITASDAVLNDCRASFKDAIDEATRTGAIEKKAQEAPEDDWINARI